MNKMGNTKGITLISLVVTIIILLILAGVTMVTLMGNNGLLNKAKDAKIATEIADIKEQIQTEILGKQAENEGNISDNTLKGILEKYGVLSEEGEKLVDKTLTTKKGNHNIKVAEIVKGTTIKDMSKEPTFTTIANAPNMKGFNRTETYYVSWDLTNSPHQINEDTNLNGIAPSNWYDYTQGVNHWANVKTTGGENACYWVWIPRYAYKITYANEGNRSSGTIDVVYLKDKTNKDLNGNDVTLSSYIDAKGNTGAYIVHPAFTKAGNGGFGELTGIWVAKFEASSNSSAVVENPTESQLAIDGGSTEDTDLKIRVRPNVTSWRGITVNNIYIVCRNLTKPDNSLCGENNTENTNIDSHMMKNTEWGAVAYLSRSIYGKNGPVWNNPYYNNSTNRSPITGLAGDSQGANQTNLTNTYKYNEVGGENASTTGNVYGVYDMVGGAFEYVAGYLDEVLTNNSTLRKNSQSLYNADDKYKDVYAGTSTDRNTNYNANTGKYGDAIYETSSSGDSFTDSWDSSYSSFPVSSQPFFIRGGHAVDGVGSGVFSFVNAYGGEGITVGFRPVVFSSQ